MATRANMIYKKFDQYQINLDYILLLSSCFHFSLSSFFVRLLGNPLAVVNLPASSAFLLSDVLTSGMGIQMSKQTLSEILNS